MMLAFTRWVYTYRASALTEKNSGVYQEEINGVPREYDKTPSRMAREEHHLHRVGPSEWRRNSITGKHPLPSSLIRTGSAGFSRKTHQGNGTIGSIGSGSVTTSRPDVERTVISRDVLRLSQNTLLLALPLFDVFLKQRVALRQQSIPAYFGRTSPCSCP
jgi:hypothetical protein